jgi:hypothetical protein
MLNQIAKAANLRRPEAMECGGNFDLNGIAWFNGGLFDGLRALPLDAGDIGLLVAACSLDWG